MSPERRLEEVIHLAELCIDVLQQNEEHHAEVWLCTSLSWKLPINGSLYEHTNVLFKNNIHRLRIVNALVMLKDISTRINLDKDISFFWDFFLVISVVVWVNHILVLFHHWYLTLPFHNVIRFVLDQLKLVSKICMCKIPDKTFLTVIYLIQQRWNQLEILLQCLLPLIIF